MTELFKAGNGLEVGVGSDGMVLAQCRTRSFDGAECTQALREFFQHERDQELGRWRSNVNPGWVGYENGTDRAVLIHEPSGDVRDVRRGYVFPISTLMTNLVKEYFDAHPESKPWHEARDGQLWLIRFSDYPNTDVSALVKNGTFVYNDHCHDGIAAVNDSTITAGRRIWPEVSDA